MLARARKDEFHESHESLLKLLALRGLDHEEGIRDSRSSSIPIALEQTTHRELNGQA